jgi:ABC-type sugar transport system permease subunit
LLKMKSPVRIPSHNLKTNRLSKENISLIYVCLSPFLLKVVFKMWNPLNFTFFTAFSRADLPKQNNNFLQLET